MGGREEDKPAGPSPPAATGWRMPPAVALAVLAPVVAEVLFGATRVSVILVLLPQIAVWGCGTVLIRDAVRRRGRGWHGLLLLGAALAVAEECIIQQTSLAPLVGHADDTYGRLGGVNWVYLLWAVGHESIWVVVLPVYLAERVFSARRAEVWLGRRGLIVATGLFLGGSSVAWYTWTQQARTMVFHMPKYQPPASLILLALATIAVLVTAALGPRRLSWPQHVRTNRPAPQPSRVGLAAFLLALPWTLLVVLAFGALPAVPFAIPLVAGGLVAVVVLALFDRWTASASWNDWHRFAVVSGGITACMAGGFTVFAFGGALTVDWVGKAMLNAIAAAWLTGLGRRGPPSAQAVGSSHDLVRES